MVKIKTLKDSEGNSFYPQTHIKGIVDDNGNNLEAIFSEQEKQLDSKIAEHSTVHVEIGGMTDSTGLPAERDDRIRCRRIMRKDILIRMLERPVGLYLWIQRLDINGNLIGTNSTLWGGNSVLDIYSIDEETRYFNFVFKREDGGTITDVDVEVAKKYISDILNGYSFIRKYNIIHNLGAQNIRVERNKVFIEPAGFGVRFDVNNVYYIADASKTRTEPYEFELPTDVNSYLVVDTTKLINKGARTELSDVVSIKREPRITDIVIAYSYTRYNEAKITLLGDFADLYNDVDENRKVNERMFTPEFYAYGWGRKNNSSGIGENWYRRFRISHVSDVHICWEQLQEAFSVSNDKVNVFINTGDVANGVRAEEADRRKEELSISMNNVNRYCTIPFMQVPGNHDVPGLTKQDFFNLVCATVAQFSSNVVWGDIANYKAYGYVDFTSTDYEGNFRIIMLDPFDYADGQFGTVYPHMSAVFSQSQIDWLVETLLDAATKGLNVMTVMHYSFGDAEFSNEDVANPDAQYWQDPFMIPDIIDAIQNKSALNKTYADSKEYNNITINEDFSSAADLNFVAHLFGHIHSKNHYQCQKADGSKKYDILMLGETAVGVNGIALNKVYKESGTINDIAFSALEVDTVEKAVYRVSYGAYLNYDKSNSERTTKIPYRFS